PCPSRTRSRACELRRGVRRGETTRTSPRRSTAPAPSFAPRSRPTSRSPTGSSRRRRPGSRRAPPPGRAADTWCGATRTRTGRSRAGCSGTSGCTGRPRSSRSRSARERSCSSASARSIAPRAGRPTSPSRTPSTFRPPSRRAERGPATPPSRALDGAGRGRRHWRIASRGEAGRPPGKPPRPPPPHNPTAPEGPADAAPAPGGRPGLGSCARFGVDERLVREALAEALVHGGDHADLFFQHRVANSYALEDGAVNRAFTQVELGVGVRVVRGDQTGYSFTQDLSPHAVKPAAPSPA